MLWPRKIWSTAVYLVLLFILALLGYSKVSYWVDEYNTKTYRNRYGIYINVARRYDTENIVDGYNLIRRFDDAFIARQINKLFPDKSLEER